MKTYQLAKDDRDPRRNGWGQDNKNDYAQEKYYLLELTEKRGISQNVIDMRTQITHIECKDIE